MMNHNGFAITFLAVLAIFAQAVACGAARAQDESPKLEVGLDYNYVHANGPPGGCGCFSMNGGNGWVGLRLTNSFSAVGEFSAQHAGNIDNTGEDLTLFSYLFGPRFTLRKSERILPFGQVLVGGAHSTGTFEPSPGVGAGLRSFSPAAVSGGGSGSFNAFAMVAGGGLDLKVSRHFGIRAFEADYYFTHFPNGVNDHQNNLRIAAGIIFRF